VLYERLKKGKNQKEDEKEDEKDLLERTR